MITRRDLLAVASAAVSGPLAAQKGSQIAVPANLLCEYLVNPLGIDEIHPRLNWELKLIDARARGVKQTAFQVLVASSADSLQRNTGDLWDSGRVESDQSIHVVYSGKPLGSRMRCHWKVRVWDQNGTPSAWSEPALWTMGLLEPEDWSGSWIGLDEPAPKSPPWFPGAQWIWYPEGKPKEDAPAGLCYFRRNFELPKGRAVAAAELYLIADGRCSASVNGQVAGEGGPVRTDDCWKKPQPLDVRSLLQPGPNVLAVEAENTARSKPNPAGLISLLRVRFDDGLEWSLASDREWRVSHTLSTSDADWRSVMELGPFGMPPWNKVNPEEYTTLPARMLRREFEIAPKLRRATAYVCGLGYFEFYLNGRRVGDQAMAPVMTDYQRKIHYITFEVTEHLRQGRNATGILLGNGPFFAYRRAVPAPFRTFGYPKALVNVRLEFDDGSFEDVATDANWKVTTDGPLRANNEYDGETYDARREQPGWSDVGFNESAWRRVELVESPGGKLRAQMLEPQRVIETLRPVAITEPRPNVFVVDFGQTFHGWVRLKASGPAGTEVHLRRGGILRADGTVRKEDSRSALMTDVYTLSGRGKEVWAPRFSSQGGRFVEVTGFPGSPSAENFEGLVIHTDMKPAGAFECSNDLVNRLFQMMRSSQRIEARGVPLDCSTRDERMPWISEHHGMEGRGYTYRIAAMYSNWLSDIRLSQRPDGSIPNVAPSYWTFGQGVVWPVTLFYLPSWFHAFYGDLRAVERSYASMKRLLDFIRNAHLKSDSTIDFNDHGDWLDSTTMGGQLPFLGSTPQPLISTAFFYFYCRTMERVARLLGRSRDVEWFAGLGDKVRAGFNRRFFDSASNAYEGRTQTSYVLPLAFGLVPEDRRAAVAHNLVQDVLVTHKGHTTCGFMGVQWILTVLSETGHHDAAYSILTRTERPSWGYMASKGATTMWERWDHDTADPTMTGESQYFLGADIAGWLFRTLGGIRSDPERPGFKHIILRPQPCGDLKWVKSSFHSPYGLITSSWQIAGGKFKWDVTVPPNTTATAHVPAAREVHELASGIYAFEAEWR